MARALGPRVYKPHGLTGPLSNRIKEGLGQGKFTPAEQAIAIAMLEDWHRTALSPAARLAEHANCDKAAVSRFVRRLGYSSHLEFKRAAQAEINRQDYQAEERFVGADEEKSSWLMREIAHLENDAKAFILKSGSRELEETADQIELTASRLSRANRIIIVAATTGAIPFVPVIQELFASSMAAAVGEAFTAEAIPPRVGNFLVILHAGSSPYFSATAIRDREIYDWKAANIGGVHAVHLVIDGADPERSNSHRVLHLHDGGDRLAGLSIMISTCIILIREATKRAPSKAR